MSRSILRMLRFGSIGLAMTTISSLAAAEALGPHDFARGREVELRDPAPLQTLLLDLAVYRGTVEAGLADLRVFNGGGEPVPHAVRTLARPRSVGGRLVEVPLFRLPDLSPGEAETRSIAGGDARAYRIDAEVSDTGAVVRIRSEPDDRSDADAEVPEPPAAYLLDASQLGSSVDALELDLAPGTAQFVVPARVEGSNDLTRFRTLGERVALVRLDQAGHRIESSRLDIPTSRYRYLKVSSVGERLPVAINRVRVRLAPRTEPPPRDEVRVPGRAVAGEPGAFLFDLGGEVPIDRLQVDLPSANTLVEAQLLSSRSEDGPWARQFSGVLYDLEHERPLRNAEIPWRVTRHRYFKLVVSGKGGGLGSGTPVLEASWYPEQLLFITRGSPPFRLGYGRSAVQSTHFGAAELIATTRSSTRTLPRATALLGAEYTVAGDDVLAVAENPVSMRTIALWAVLVLCVAVVLALSLRLLRQARERSPEI